MSPEASKPAMYRLSPSPLDLGTSGHLFPKIVDDTGDAHREHPERHTVLRQIARTDIKRGAVHAEHVDVLDQTAESEVTYVRPAQVIDSGHHVRIDRVGRLTVRTAVQPHVQHQDSRDGVEPGRPADR